MMQPYSEGTFDDVAKYKFEQAEDDLEAAKLLLEAGKYKAANNRAYYSCFHAIDAVLAKDVVDSLNQHNTDLLACLWSDLYTVISLQKEKGPRAPSVTSRVL